MTKIIYQEELIELPANDVQRVETFATEVKFLQIEGSVLFSINDERENIARQGISIRLPPGVTATSITLREVSGSGTATVTMALSNGQIIDDRSSIVGAIPVLNAEAPNDVLSVGDANNEALLTEIRNLLQEPQYIDLFGTTRSVVSNSFTFVSAAQNIGGIFIECAEITAIQYTGAALYIGNFLITGHPQSSGAHGTSYTINRYRVERMRLPPGLALQFTEDATGGIDDPKTQCAIAYRLL